MIDAERYAVRDPQVISETIDGEVIIVNLENGNYYSADGAAADVWSLLEQGVAVPAILECLAQKYDGASEEISVSVQEFIRQLQEEELIAPSSDSGLGGEAAARSLPAVDSDDAPISFEAPVLERYTDMQDLLLVDPIHEVDEEGWPRTKVQ